MDVEKNFKQFGLNKAEEIVDDPSKVKVLLGKITKMLGKKGLSSILVEINELISYIRDVISGKYTGYSAWALTIAIGAIAYVVAPIDAIPDVLVGLGFTDDVAVVLYAIKKLHDELQQYRQWKS